jgi:hypothetical protein
MEKSKLVALIVYVVVAGAFLFVAMNAHMDIYPCRIQRYEFSPRAGYAYPTDSTCSLLTIQRASEGPPSDKAKLTTGGWAVLILVHALVVPLPFALGARWFMRRKKSA